MTKYEAERQITRILQQLEEDTDEIVEAIAIEIMPREAVGESIVELRIIRIVTSLKKRWY